MKKSIIIFIVLFFNSNISHYEMMRDLNRQWRQWTIDEPGVFITFNGMAYDDDPSGPRVRLAREVGDLVLGAGRRGPGAMVSAVDALKSGEVEEEEQEDATFLDAEQRRRARERRANGQQEGAMAELNEGEVLTEDIDK